MKSSTGKAPQGVPGNCDAHVVCVGTWRECCAGSETLGRNVCGGSLHTGEITIPFDTLSFCFRRGKSPRAVSVFECDVGWGLRRIGMVWAPWST
jgi:hypothetical protein